MASPSWGEALYSPQLQVIERFWKVLRRRVTHNRLFPTIAQLKRTIRNSRWTLLQISLFARGR